MRPNDYVRVAGVVLLLISAGTAVALSDQLSPRTEAGGGLVSFMVSWGTREVSADGPSGTLADGASVTEAVAVTEFNLTAVGVGLTWTDSQPIFRPAATVSIDVTNESGEDLGGGGSNDGAAGVHVPYSVEGGKAPEPLTIKAADLSDAWRKLAALHPPSEAGQEQLDAAISSTRGGPCAPIICLRSGSVAYTMTLTLTVYEATITPAGKGEGH